MGSEIAGHVFSSNASLDPLSALPKSIAYSARSDGKHVFLEFFPTKNQPEGTLPDLWNRVQKVLSLPGEIEKHFRTGVKLSSMLDTTVLSFIADDDLMDAAIETKKGDVVRIHLDCGDLEMLFTDNKVTVQELLSEDDEEDERPEALLSELAKIEGVTVRARPKRMTSELHRLVMDEIERFLGGGPVPEWSTIPVIAGAGVTNEPKAATIDPKRIQKLRSAYDITFNHDAYEASLTNPALASLNVWLTSQNALICAMASLRVENDIARATRELASALPFLFLILDSDAPISETYLRHAFPLLAAIGAPDLAEALARRVQSNPVNKKADEWHRFVHMLAAAVLGDRASFDEHREAIAKRKVNRGYTASYAPYVPAIDALLRGDAPDFERTLNAALELFAQRPKNRDIDQHDPLSGGKGSSDFAIDYLAVFLIRVAAWRGLAFATPRSPYLPQVLLESRLIADPRQHVVRD
jgi:hypothetical protein